MKTHFNIDVRGFNAGETDIRDYVARSATLDSDPQLALVYESVFEAVFANPNGQKYCAILFIGHADRVPAGTENARRADEEKAAQERADNARSWTLEKVNALATAAGFTPVPDWASADNAVAYQVGVGAANLAVTPGTLAAGLENRRVEIVVAGLNVSIIDQNDTADLVVRG